MTRGSQVHDILSDTTLVDLVEHIYAAGCDPDAWQAFVDQVYARLPHAAFSTHLSIAGTGLTGCSSGLPEAQLRSYLEHYHTLNPYVPIFERLEIGKVYTV